MSTEFRFDADRQAFARLTDRVRDMRERAEDLTPAWDALLTWFAEQNFEQFLTRGARYRKQWSPLAPRTLREKLAKGYPLDPLIRTGKLAQDLTHRPLGVEHMTPTSVSAGTDIDYARFHMRGTRRMPARPMFRPSQIRKEQAATTAVANWVIHGRAEVSGRTEMRGAP